MNETQKQNFGKAYRAALVVTRTEEKDIRIAKDRAQAIAVVGLGHDVRDSKAARAAKAAIR